MSDLDLVNWHQVARAVIAADFSLRHGADWRKEPSAAAKQTAFDCVQEHKEAERLEAAGFKSVGGFWCRVEEDEIAPYTRQSAIRRLNKEEIDA